MNPTRVPLPCGCAAIVDHHQGERRLTCTGGGLYLPDGVRLVDRERMVVCPGGRGYVVKAEQVATVVHTVAAITSVQPVDAA